VKDISVRFKNKPAKKKPEDEDTATVIVENVDQE
jgi:hypothetical protein